MQIRELICNTSVGLLLLRRIAAFARAKAALTARRQRAVLLVLDPGELGGVAWLEPQMQEAVEERQRATNPRDRYVQGSWCVCDVARAVSILVSDQTFGQDSSNRKPPITAFDRLRFACDGVPGFNIHVDLSENEAAGKCPEQHAHCDPGVGWRHEQSIHEEEGAQEVSREEDQDDADVAPSSVALENFPVFDSLFAKASEPVVSADSKPVNQPSASNNGGQAGSGAHKSPVAASALTRKFPPQISNQRQLAHRPVTYRFLSFSRAIKGSAVSCQISLKGLLRTLPKE